MIKCNLKKPYPVQNYLLKSKFNQALRIISVKYNLIYTYYSNTAEALVNFKNTTIEWANKVISIKQYISMFHHNFF